MNKPKYLIVLLFSALILSGCKHGGNTTLLNKVELKTVKNERKLKQLLKDGNPRWDNEDMNVYEPPTADSETNSVESPATEDVDFVGTNEQVSGVSEGDVIKTDGDFVYYALPHLGEINVFRRDGNDELHYYDSVETKGYLETLYLVNDYLVTVSYGYSSSYGIAEDFRFYYWGRNMNTAITVYDKVTLELVYELEVLDGYLIEHRIIEDTMYLVTNSYVSVAEEDNRPTFSENESESDSLHYNEIYYFDDTLVTGMTTITGIKLHSDPDQIFYNASSYLGAAYSYKNIFVSLDNLFIFDGNYYYESARNLWKHWTNTTISQFSLDLDNAKVTFVAAGLVNGISLNQFSADYYQNHLRLATTEHFVEYKYEDNTYTSKEEVNNHLYVLKSNDKGGFKLVGHLSEGLGKPNETIKSVRFNEGQAYIVTFLQTDPLYVIDLSDLTNPVMTDAIELPGFDTYQHPWADSFLLGLGYDADSRGWTTGLKMSAYNVTAGEASLLQTHILGAFMSTNENDTYTSEYYYSEGMWNHKALLVSEKHSVFGLPLTAQSYSYNYETWASTHETEHRYLVFNIDFSAEQPISEMLRVVHPTLSEMSDDYYYYYHNQINRSLYINGTIFFFSPAFVSSYDLLTKTYYPPVLSREL